ncbi:hypothetical protein PHMEG_00025350 [Phytophthora megakarya]|uniref:AAA+ ATPase domain-containing protein n=1 Tax=Phytophthora megakarya TaxID=4795 RepID=A0A225VD05_9STRA|nr:hypothetical protein PHMEG_00025350 [Phytophthora megakarya]
MERKRYTKDTLRYYYIQTGGPSLLDKDTRVTYKRYALGEEKTFENLFFEEKENVVQLLDNFTNKSGKFAIKGFPYKLGLLLHGPPGTGKTSLIKAIAQHTRRHIVTISLGKIHTNQQLLDALFDMKFAVQGLDSPVEMDFEDVVFVMEDIDCASSIVNARNDSDKKPSKADRMFDSQKKAVEEDPEEGMAGLIGPMLKPKGVEDKLNLSGLLNVLDGVIDCPGRIVIMTTNYPEKLDPALVRPGRVNKKLLLGHMGPKQVREMVEYYCDSSLSDEQQTRLDAIFDEMKAQFTPAEIEEFCAEFDDIDSILAKSGVGKTYFSSRLDGYEVLELDKVVENTGKAFDIEESVAFKIYKNNLPAPIMDAFVANIHSFFRQYSDSPIVVEGAIADAELVKRIFSGPYAEFMFVYLHPIDVDAPILVEGAIADAALVKRIFSGPYTQFEFVYLYPVDVDAYAARMMKRFKIERENGIRNLSVWSHVPPDLAKAKDESEELKQFMLRMALRSMLKSAQRYDYFVTNSFDMIRVEV